MKWIILLIALTLTGCASTHKQSPAQSPSGASPSASAASNSTPSHHSGMAEAAKLSCMNGSETRTLAVLNDGPGCSLVYEKLGKKATVSSSSHGHGHCIQSEKKIRTKLEQAGFKCT